LIKTSQWAISPKKQKRTPSDYFFGDFAHWVQSCQRIVERINIPFSPKCIKQAHVVAIVLPGRLPGNEAAA